MSVYTHLSKQDIDQLLNIYDIGNLTGFTGVEGGVENTNYFLDLENKGIETRYVLTLFEYLSADALPFFIRLTDELAAANVSVPFPVRDRDGVALHTLKGKPALIAPCFKGQHQKELSPEHCHQVGKVLGEIHCVGLKSNLQQDNKRGMKWLGQQQRRLAPLLTESDAQLMAEQWQSIVNSLAEFNQLPEGLIHGDLFHDNVLFENDRITGVIDFYNACHDWLLYDVAVAVNDWCLKPDLSLDPHRSSVFLSAYQQIRPFTEDEKKAWPSILRLASFRFWVSRIITFIHPEEGSGDEHEQHLMRNFKNPDTFRDILIHRTDIHPPPIEGIDLFF